MQNLYPLKFTPLYHDKIWGGHKLKTALGKDFGDLPNCGESWELSGVSGNISEVSNGFLAGNNLEELIEVYMGDLVGDKVYEKFSVEFPLLIKFIDANDDLSVQVHTERRNGKRTSPGIRENRNVVRFASRQRLQIAGWLQWPHRQGDLFEKDGAERDYGRAELCRS